MKRLLLFIQVLVLSFMAYGQENRTQLKLHSFLESKSDGGMENLGTFFQKGWPKDVNGEKDCAWVRVTFENLTDADAEKVDFNFGNVAAVVKKTSRLQEKEREIWIFVTPCDEAFMEAKLPKYGSSNRLPDIKLEPRHVYDVVLKNDKTLSINITTKPDNIKATLETGQETLTTSTVANVAMGTITDVAMGKHIITLSKDGKTLKTEEIVVTEQNVRFEYDLRERRTIRFVSEPSGAVLYINDQEIGKTPMNYELPYDSYSVEAVMGPNEIDSKALIINENTPSEIVLEPVKKKTFEAIAIYGGTKVNADLYVDGKREGKNQPAYTLTKPIGKTYNMTMTYKGFSKERKIKVTNNMENVQKFKIAAKNYIVWPWQRDYDVAPMGISVGYVAKQLVTNGQGEKFKEDGAWHKDGKFLHGFQLGIHFQPCFSFGLGVYTGLFYELYYSKDSEADDGDYDEFMEHCLYVPLHAYYRIPFAKKTALSIHGGFGFSYSVSGEYKNSDSGLDDVTDFYGEDNFPKKLNVTADIGLGLRIGSIQINAQYSKGLSDHKTYEYTGDYKTRQNKFNVGLSYVFGSN